MSSAASSTVGAIRAATSCNMQSPVRRDKAHIFSGCESHPAKVAPAGSNRSSGGGDEAAEASGVEGRLGRLGEHTGRNVRER